MAPKRPRTRSAARLAAPSTSASLPPPPRPSSVSDESDGDEYLPKEEGRRMRSNDDDDDSGSDDFADSDDSSDESLSEASRERRFEWRREENVPKQFRFSGHPGVNCDRLHRESSPFKAYSCFITSEVMDLLVKETNRCHRQRPTSSSSSHVKRWHDVSREEMHTYFGLRLLMGLQPRSDMRTYWSLDPITSHPVFPKTMSRDRFLQLSQFLHAGDSSATSPDDDGLWRLRPLIEALNRQFSSVYTPPGRVAVDKFLLNFRKHSCSDVSVRGVPIRLKIEAYRLCVSDEATAGYTCAFSIYAGRGRRDFPKSTKAIIDLMSAADLFGKGYVLYTDDRFTSPALVHLLQIRNTNAVGLVRPSRKHMPTDLDTRVRGDVDFRSTPTGMLCLQWFNQNPVTVLSTMHTSELVTERTRFGLERTKPRAVSEHHAAVRGARQLAQSFPDAREAMWYKKVIFDLHNMAVVNAYCVHKAVGGNLTFLEFKRMLIRKLIMKSVSTRTDVSPFDP